MRRCLVLITLAVSGMRAGGQAAGDAEKRAVKQQATELMRAYSQGRHARFVELTYPEVVRLAGGRDKLIAALKAVDHGMRAQGWSYGPVTVGDAKQFAWMDRVLVTTLAFSVEYVGEKRRRKDESYLIGLSADRGRSWTFVDGRKLTRANIQQLFPKFPDAIELPAGKKDR